VTTATGHFTLTVIRDVTEARRLEDLAGLARDAAAADLAHHGQELLNTVVTSLYNAGLGLQAAARMAHDAASQRIAEAVGHLDDTISEICETASLPATTALRPIPHCQTVPGDVTEHLAEGPLTRVEVQDRRLPQPSAGNRSRVSALPSGRRPSGCTADTAGMPLAAHLRA